RASPSPMATWCSILRSCGWVRRRCWAQPGRCSAACFANWTAFNRTVQSAQGNDRLTREDAELMWANVQVQHGHRMNHLVIQYLKDRKRFEKSRWLPSLALVKEPVHICWGDADAVSPAEVARHLKEHVCPRARLTLMPGVGHFCQLTDPDT